MDVKSAFLYGTIKEEIYVSQPLRFVDPEFPDKVYKVEKALYGLNQAPRAWCETLSTYLLDNRFRRRTIDKTLFIKQIKDEILLTSSMRELTFFLGLQVEQQKDGIFISQDKYVYDILKKFGFSSVKSVSTPIETHKPLSKDAAGTNVDVHLYRSMISSFMYLTSSRPDIMFSVCACSRFQVQPKVSHMHAMKRIYRYLKCQPTLGLWYPKDSPLELISYSDSNYAGSSLDRKSTTGGLKLKGYLINDGYVDLVQHADKKELAISGQTATGKELSNPLMGGSLPKTTLPTLLVLNVVSAVQLLLNAASCTMTSSIICLANNQKFNFSKYILDNLKKNLEVDVPFYMFSRFVQVFVNHQIGDISHHTAVEEVGDLPTPILDAPSSFQPQRKHKPMRKEKKERKEIEVSLIELPTEDHVLTPSNDPLPNGDDSMPLKELMVLCTNLSNKVLDLENKVIEMKSSHKAKIADLESRVEKLEEENMSLTKDLKSFNSKVESPAFKEAVVDKEKSSKYGRKNADIDADAEVNLENVNNLDMAHKETILSMQDVTDADGKEVDEEMVEVIITAKIIINEVSTGGGKLNAASEEPVSVAPTNTTTAQPKEATKITVDITTAPKAKGIVFHDVEESTTRTASSKAHVKDKGKANLVEEPEVLKSRKAQIAIDKKVTRRIEAEKHVSVAQARKNMMIYLKNMAGFKMEFFKGMGYEEIRPLFEEEYNKVQTLFKEGPEIDAERIKAPRKRTRKKNVEKDQTAKKQKGDKLEKENVEKQNLKEQQEAEELKRNLKIVPDDEDDVFMNVAPLSSKPPTIVDYKIYKKGKKEHF
nr:hypothetical protein [Tanacetum cinerariifolium]